MIDRNDPQELGLAIIARMRHDNISVCEAADRTYNDMKTYGYTFLSSNLTTGPYQTPGQGGTPTLSDRPESV